MAISNQEYASCCTKCCSTCLRISLKGNEHLWECLSCGNLDKSLGMIHVQKGFKEDRVHSQPVTPDSSTAGYFLGNVPKDKSYRFTYVLGAKTFKDFIWNMTHKKAPEPYFR